MFEKFIKVSINEFDINPLFSLSLPGCKWQCGFNYTDNKLQTLQDRDMFILPENNIHGGLSSVMGDTDIKSNDRKKLLYIDANNLYGHSMYETLSNDEIKFDNFAEFEDIINTPVDTDIGHVFEVVLSSPDNKNKKTFVHFVLKIKLNLKMFSMKM